MGKILDINGQTIAPQPNQLTEDRINAELQMHYDPLLFIGWIKTAYHVSGDLPSDLVFEGRYALCHRWPQVDPRWGELGFDYPDSYDILGWFCDDMQDASSVPQEPSSIMQKVFELLGKCDNERFPWADRIMKTVEKNKAITARGKEEALDIVTDVAADHYHHTSKATRIFT